MHRSKISPNGGKPPGRVLPRESRKLTAETQRRRDAETQRRRDVFLSCPRKRASR